MAEYHKIIRRSRGRRRSPAPRGMTLVELVIVMGIVGIVTVVTLPSIVKMFSAGSDAQAYNLMSSTLAAARSEAVGTSNYVGVHVQLADAVDGQGQLLHPKLENVCFTAMVALKSFKRGDIADQYLDAEEAARGNDENVGRFVLADGPNRMPVNIAFGELKSTYVDSASGKYKSLGDPGFTAFTVVFSPTGALTRQVQGKNVRFHHDSELFVGPKRLWKVNVAHNNNLTLGEPGATALTMFNYEEFSEKDYADPSGVDAIYRALYLNQCGQFLTINVYTGHLNTRK